MDKALEDALDYAREFGLTDRAIAQVVRAEADRLRFDETPAQVTLTHPNLPGRTIEALPDAVEHWQNSGWQVQTASEPDASQDDAYTDTSTDASDETPIRARPRATAKKES